MGTKMNRIRLTALCALAFLLSSCETYEGMMEDISNFTLPAQVQSSVNAPEAKDFVADGHCPKVEIVNDLGILHEFSGPPSPSSLVSRTVLSVAESACSYNLKSATVNLKLAFTTTTGSPTDTHPFFVAVTAPNGDILAKEVFTADLGAGGQPHYESLKQVIPVASEEKGKYYRVLVGFQLGSDHLAYNKAYLESLKEAQKVQAKAAKAQAVVEEKRATGGTIYYPPPPVEQEPLDGNPIDITGQN